MPMGRCKQGRVAPLLVDALSRPVRTLQVPAQTVELPLDLTGLAPGLYLLHLTADGTTATRRLVVE